MIKMKKLLAYRPLQRLPMWSWLVLLPACAGLNRGCSSCAAEQFGGDWVVVELREIDGTPYRCWYLSDVSISSEVSSDGVYWKDTKTGNLVHISGSYDYVQVVDDNWDEAFAYVGLTRSTCDKIQSGRYSIETGNYEYPE